MNRHARKYGANTSYPIPVWNGILEHCQKIGPALWEFLWCIDKVTLEDEHGIGWCLGKTPIDTKRIAADLHEHEHTAHNNLTRLAVDGYIVRKRTPRGYCIGVVNSRKFHAFRAKSESHKSVTHKGSDSEKTPNHNSGKEPKSESQETVTHNGSESHKTVTHSESESQETGEVNDSFLDGESHKTVIARDTTRHYRKTKPKAEAEETSKAAAARDSRPHEPTPPPPTPEILDAFASFRSRPYGPPAFQEFWALEYHRLDEIGDFSVDAVDAAMEQTIHRCKLAGIPIPPPFYKIKTQVRNGFELVYSKSEVVNLREISPYFRLATTAPQSTPHKPALPRMPDDE
jgi:hypothetical protein